jgi:hypothetical protein
MAGIALRIIVGVVALLALFLAGQFWLDPAAAGAKMGLFPHGALGLATLRADNGGAFGTIGLLALTGAIRGEGRYLRAPLVFLGLALISRFITLAISGVSPELIPPMIIEAVLIVLLGVTLLVLRPRAT